MVSLQKNQALKELNLSHNDFGVGGGIKLGSAIGNLIYIFTTTQVGWKCYVDIKRLNLASFDRFERIYIFENYKDSNKQKNSLTYPKVPSTSIFDSGK